MPSYRREESPVSLSYDWQRDRQYWKSLYQETNTSRYGYSPRNYDERPSYERYLRKSFEDEDRYYSSMQNHSGLDNKRGSAPYSQYYDDKYGSSYHRSRYFSRNSQSYY